MRYLQRKAIMLDVNWKNGNYYDVSYPLSGIRLAREIATVTYRSGPEWNQRFGRKLIDKDKEIDLCPSFEIENYLNYQGETFSTKYDPNSLIYLSKAMDLFDISEDYSTIIEALSNIKCPVMIMGAKTDALFPIEQQRELSTLLKESGNHSVTYFEMDSLYGHDTFLLNLNDVGTAVKGFLEAQLINMTKNLSKTK
jgi:homoserine O-acetyltransferase